VRKEIYDITMTCLTVYALLHSGLCNPFLHAIVLRLFRFQNYNVRCGSWVGAASGTQLYFAIHNRSAGFTILADRDSIVERHEEGVGISAKWRMRSTMSA
jgi:hypothetical protein